MKFLTRILFAFALIFSSAALPVLAGDTDPLFVNLTTDDPHRANMGITFGKNQMERGHPLTIFLNDKAVVIGSRAGAGRFPEDQKMLAEVVNKGGVVLICPMCMKHYGVKESDFYRESRWVTPN